MGLIADSTEKLIEMVHCGVVSPNDFKDIYMERDLQDNKDRYYTYTAIIDSNDLIYDNSHSISYVNIPTADFYIDGCYLPKEEHHFNCKFCGAPNQVDVCEYCGCAYEE